VFYIYYFFEHSLFILKKIYDVKILIPNKYKNRLLLENIKSNVMNLNHAHNPNAMNVTLINQNHFSLINTKKFYSLKKKIDTRREKSYENIFLLFLMGYIYIYIYIYLFFWLYMFFFLK